MFVYLAEKKLTTHTLLQNKASFKGLYLQVIMGFLPLG